jgi:hypothetical protein
VFTTFKDFQQSVKIRVYQGESRVQEENELLGEFEFSGFKNARRGEVRIEVTFEIDTGLSEEELRQLVAKHDAKRAAAPPPPPAPRARPAVAPVRAPALVAPVSLAAGAAAEPEMPSLDGPELELETDDDALAPLAGDEVALDTADAGAAPESWQGGAAQEFDLDLAGGGDVELAPAGAADAAPADPDRTMAVGGEIDLEALVEAQPEPAPVTEGGGEEDLDPLDLDEADLDSLAALADEPAKPAATPEAPPDENASTRPRALVNEEGSLFDDPGADLSRYRDDEPS